MNENEKKIEEILKEIMSKSPQNSGTIQEKIKKQLKELDEAQKRELATKLAKSQSQQGRVDKVMSKENEGEER